MVRKFENIFNYDNQIQNGKNCCKLKKPLLSIEIGSTIILVTQFLTGLDY